MVKHGTKRAALEISRMCLMTSSMRRYTLHNRNIRHHKSMLHVVHVCEDQRAVSISFWRTCIFFLSDCYFPYHKLPAKSPLLIPFLKILFPPSVPSSPLISDAILRPKTTLNDWHYHPHLVWQFSGYRNEMGAEMLYLKASLERSFKFLCSFSRQDHNLRWI